MSKTTVLVVDNLRNPRRDTLAKYLRVDASDLHFLVARNTVEAITAINNYVDVIDHIFLDHDGKHGSKVIAKFLCSFYDDIEPAVRPMCHLYTKTSDNKSLDHIIRMSFSTVIIPDPDVYFEELDTSPNQDVATKDTRIIRIETSEAKTRHIFINRDNLFMGTVEKMNHAMSMSTQIVFHTLDTDIVGEELILDVIDDNYDVVTKSYGQIISITRTTLGTMYGVN